MKCRECGKDKFCLADNIGFVRCLSCGATQGKDAMQDLILPAAIASVDLNHYGETLERAEKP